MYRDFGCSIVYSLDLGHSDLEVLDMIYTLDT